MYYNENNDDVLCVESSNMMPVDIRSRDFRPD